MLMCCFPRYENKSAPDFIYGFKVPFQPKNPFFPENSFTRLASFSNKCKKPHLKIHRNNRDKRTSKFFYFHTPG